MVTRGPRQFRYRQDVGFERRCPTCTDWWPITLEFWEKRWTARCKACIRVWQRANARRRYAADPVYAEDRRASSRLTGWKDRANRPLEASDKKAAYYRANAARICERQRIKYHAKKNAA